MTKFIDKHPFLTFFLGLAAISAGVAVFDDLTGTVRSVAGSPKPQGPLLPPRPVAVPR